MICLKFGVDCFAEFYTSLCDQTSFNRIIILHFQISHNWIINYWEENSGLGVGDPEGKSGNKQLPMTRSQKIGFHVRAQVYFHPNRHEWVVPNSYKRFTIYSKKFNVCSWMVLCHYVASQCQLECSALLNEGNCCLARLYILCTICRTVTHEAAHAAF